MLLDFVLAMAVEGDVRKLGVIREPKARRYSARPMEVVAGANILVAQRVLKVVQSTALVMVVVDDAVTMVALVLLGVSLACASGMVAARGVR